MLNFLAAIAGNGAGGGGSFESIATATASGVNTLTFTSIPSTYRHLQIRGIARHSFNTTGAQADLFITFNSDTGSNYADHRMWGDGASVTASGSSSIGYAYARNMMPYNGEASGIFGVTIIDIHDYASTTKNKTLRTIVGNDRNGGGRITLESSLWASTSAITSISLSTGGDNFVNGSTFALYGIKGA